MELYESIERIRETKPLVHHLTNWVTIYDCAQITRSVGALPVMAHSRQDALEMVGIASALVLNIGTLDDELVDTMVLAAERAAELNVPVVLDPVGAGATTPRTEASKRLLDTGAITVVKGNAGEITTLAGGVAEVRGVESMAAEGAEAAAGMLASEGRIVAMTGPVDHVTDGGRTALISNGTALMGDVVGTGCMSASVIGAFAAVDPDPFEATVNALSSYGIAGEKGAVGSPTPLEFKSRLIDGMASLSIEDGGRMKVKR